MRAAVNETQREAIKLRHEAEDLGLTITGKRSRRQARTKLELAVEGSPEIRQAMLADAGSEVDEALVETESDSDGSADRPGGNSDGESDRQCSCVHCDMPADAWQGNRSMYTQCANGCGCECDGCNKGRSAQQRCECRECQLYAMQSSRFCKHCSSLQAKNGMLSRECQCNCTGCRQTQCAQPQKLEPKWRALIDMRAVNLEQDAAEQSRQEGVLRVFGCITERRSRSRQQQFQDSTSSAAIEQARQLINWNKWRVRYMSTPVATVFDKTVRRLCTVRKVRQRMTDYAASTAAGAVSIEVVKVVSTEAVKAGSTEAVKAGSPEAVKASITEAVKASSTEAVKAGSTEAVKADSADAVASDCGLKLRMLQRWRAVTIEQKLDSAQVQRRVAQLEGVSDMRDKMEITESWDVS